MPALLTAFLAASAAAAPPPAALQPLGKWMVGPAQASCRASRGFGPADAQMTLTIDRVPLQPSTWIELRVTAPASQTRQRAPATVLLSRSGHATRTTYSAQANGNGARLELYVPRDALQGLDTATGITITGDHSYALALRSMPAVTRALHDCEQSLLTSWGVSDPPDRAAATLPMVKAIAIPMALARTPFRQTPWPDAPRVWRQLC